MRGPSTPPRSSGFYLFSAVIFVGLTIWYFVASSAQGRWLYIIMGCAALGFLLRFAYMAVMARAPDRREPPARQR